MGNRNFPNEISTFPTNSTLSPVRSVLNDWEKEACPYFSRVYINHVYPQIIIQIKLCDCELRDGSKCVIKYFFSIVSAFFKDVRTSCDSLSIWMDTDSMWNHGHQCLLFVL